MHVTSWHWRNGACASSKCRPICPPSWSKSKTCRRTPGEGCAGSANSLIGPAVESKAGGPQGSAAAVRPKSGSSLAARVGRKRASTRPRGGGAAGFDLPVGEHVSAARRPHHRREPRWIERGQPRGESAADSGLIYRRAIAAWQTLFRQREDNGRATTDIAQAARAATFGAVETILVDIDRVIPRRIDNQGAVSFAEEQGEGNYDLVDEIATRV